MGQIKHYFLVPDCFTAVMLKNYTLAQLLTVCLSALCVCVSSSIPPSVKNTLNSLKIHYREREEDRDVDGGVNWLFIIGWRLYTTAQRLTHKAAAAK